jgi:hypothetical protein
MGLVLQQVTDGRTSAENTGCPKKIVLFFKNFSLGPLLFGGRHLKNFVPTGTAGISIKSKSIW